MSLDPKFYQTKIEQHSAQLASQRKRNRLYVAGELASFLSAIALVAAYTVWGRPLLPALAVAAVVAYIALRRCDVAGCGRAERLEALRRVYASELSYLSGDFTPFDDGRRYADPHHPYAVDMDVFGPLSLFHRINRTVTSGGADCLAGLLSERPLCNGAGAKRAIDRRRDFISRLAKEEAVRTAFMSYGRRGTAGANDRKVADTAAVKAALTAVQGISMPRMARSGAALAMAWALATGLTASAVAAIVTPLSGSVVTMWATAQFCAVYLLAKRPLREMGKGIDRLSDQLKDYAGLIRLAAANIAAEQDGEEQGGEVERAAAELKALVDSMDRRGNLLGLALFDTFLLYDFFLMRRLARWQQRHLGVIARWVDRVSLFDALVSAATFRFNEPEAAEAEIAETPGVLFEAEALAHPFLGAKAVGNDFTATEGNYYIVTGANMAGKSTFLRSVGVSIILATNGMPVFASRLRLSVFTLFSSMRTSDDLGHGISYFNAELLRLRQLIDHCKHASHTLIILDEILKGTNSLDKLNGSRMFLEAIARLPVTGIIATHDLELSKMAEEHPERFHNICFEISLADTITYAYKLTPGVARNQNASHLLRNILRGIAPANEGEGAKKG